MNRIVFVAAVLGAMTVTAVVLYLLTRIPEPRTSETPAPAASADAGAAPPGRPATPDTRADATPPRRTAPAAGAAPATPPPPAPLPDRGTLRIDSDVPGAQVFIDRQFIGETPVVARNLTPGTHRLNVSAPGYDGVAETIEVEPGPGELMVRLREVRLDASIPVVHKHGVGSCRGQLVATPQGLRYEAAAGDDGFTVALVDLERFEVDYLEKNLLVKVRGGRQYNFTDPDGNADPLFVFHRDVSRARERLASEQ